MTTSQHRTIAHIEAQHEAQRDLAELNSRPVLTLKAQAQSLYDAMMVAKAAGDVTKAREMATALKPLLNELD